MSSRNPDALSVADLMTPSPVTIAPATAVNEARKLLVDRRIRHLPVVDADGRLAGLVTKRDLEGYLAKGGDGQTPVTSFMVTQVDATKAEEPVGNAARHLFQTKRGCMPVLDDDRHVVGILTEADFLRWFVRNTAA